METGDRAGGSATVSRDRAQTGDGTPLGDARLRADDKPLGEVQSRGDDELPRPAKPLGIFVGMSTLDVIHYVDRPPGPDEKLFARDRIIAAGGPATNAAIAYGALGGAALVVSRLGSHRLADVVRDDMRRCGVQHVDLNPADPSPPIVSAIGVTIGTGDRAVVSSMSPPADQPLPPLPLDAARVVLLDGHQPEAALEVARSARDTGVPVVLDGGSWKPGTAELLRYVDFAICSDVFRPPGCADPADTLAHLADMGVTYRAVTRGPRPILWSADPESDGALDRPSDADMFLDTRVSQITVRRQPNVADTLGAGDVYHGAFCYHLTVGLCFPQALAAAAADAAGSCAARGARIVGR